MVNNLSDRQRIGLFITAMTVLAFELAEFAWLLAHLFWATR
ncbi:MAG: hypothetical protein ABI566_03695 [Pseudolysinimonas sp.]